MNENNSMTAIFWDYENVGFGEDNLGLFLSGLEEIKQKIKGNFVLKCFSHWSNTSEKIQNLIMNAGFELSQVPQTRKNAVDQVMMLSAVNLSHQIPFTNFILISSDGDFTALCRDFQSKHIIISIISRKNISEDLKPYAQFIYFVTSKGVLFQFEGTSREKIIEIMEQGVTDAKNACKKLNQRGNENIFVFSKEEWKKAYDSFENCQVSPFILDQIFNIDDLYQTFLQVFGFGISQNYDYFCVHELAKNKNIIDLDIFVDLPETMELRIPIQNLPASELSVFRKEYKEPPKKTPDLKPKNFLEAIVQVFKKIISDPKIKKTNLSVLNQATCKILGITPSQKMYKKAGFGTFKKAVESIKGSLPKKIKIKNNMVSW